VEDVENVAKNKDFRLREASTRVDVLTRTQIRRPARACSLTIT